MAGTNTICKQPVVAIVGHIDHGKTTLLDYIRKSAVAAKETGGITQRVSAYEVLHKGAEGERLITFIDTPGHEAFQKMRERAGAAADIAILIVASDDGVKPQTIEAYKAIKAANIPFIVAFTKVDKDTANIEKAKESVMRQEIYLEGLGGEVPYAMVSGKSGQGVPELLDLIVLASDLHNITCDAAASPLAVVIEATRDPKSGVSATVILKEGTLKTGGFAVSGTAYAPLRIIEDYTGKKVTELSCGKPARITGFSEEPKVGSTVTVVASKKEAEEAIKNAKAPAKNVERKPAAESEKMLIRVILKADTAGSVEALEHEIAKISSETAEIITVATGVGTITENDIKPLIGFAPAIVAGFNVKVEVQAKDLADRQKVIIETKAIIYELADWLKETVETLAPKKEEVIPASAQIIKHFSSQGAKHVVGGRVTEHTLRLNDRVTIVRRGIEVGTGKVINLQSQKADVKEVPAGTEFGAQIESKADIVSGDVVMTILPVKSASVKK